VVLESVPIWNVKALTPLEIVPAEAFKRLSPLKLVESAIWVISEESCVNSLFNASKFALLFVPLAALVARVCMVPSMPCMVANAPEAILIKELPVFALAVA
jgi:hypothetical protein